MPHSGQDVCSIWRCLCPQWRCPERPSVLHAENTVVQFARSTADAEEFALKFSISLEKVEAQRTVFAHWLLGAMMPHLEGMYNCASRACTAATPRCRTPVATHCRHASSWSRGRAFRSGSSGASLICVRPCRCGPTSSAPHPLSETATAATLYFMFPKTADS